MESQKKTNPAFFNSKLNFAVIGSPVDHSLSPRIHHVFADQVGLQIEYQKIDLPSNQFSFFWENNQGFFSGLNVTHPLKEEVFLCLRERGCVIDESAELAQATNTLSIGEETSLYSTDGDGFLNHLKREGFSFFKKNVLMLGLGGATKSILGALLVQPPSRLYFYNRTQTKTKQIAQNLPESFVAVDERSDFQPIDLIINGIGEESVDKLPEELKNLLKKINVSRETLFYDLPYRNKSGVWSFLSRSIGRPCQYVGGVGMLIEQAALSFEIWTGEKPNTEKLHVSLTDVSRET